MITRPMLCARLAATTDLRYPVGATPKYDGIRCMVVSGRAVSRAFKPIPNRHISECLSSLPEGIDGELLAGGFSATQSAVMSEAGTPDFTYVAFDLYSKHRYWERITRLCEAVRPLNLPFKLVVAVPTGIRTAVELDAYISKQVAAGYEGAVTRAPHGPYKFGRSTPSEQYMVKWKPYIESTATVLGFVEGRTNLNPQQLNAFGLAKRPGGKANKVPRGTLGSLVVQDKGSTFEVGSGFTEAQRAHLWSVRSTLIGTTVRYKYQELGSKGRPRFPVYLGAV